MTNEIKSAQNAQSEEHNDATSGTTTSAQLEARLLHLKAKRDAMGDELTRALTTLEAAQGAIALEDAATIERASTAQARAIVLQNAEIALSEQVCTLEGELQTAVEDEQRARALEQLATLRADLDAQNAALEAKSRDVARAHQEALTELLEDFKRSAQTATQLQFKAMETGVQLPLGQGLGFNETRFSYAVEGEVEPCVSHYCATTLQALRSAQHVREHGIQLYRESVAIPHAAPERRTNLDHISRAYTEMPDEMWVETRLDEDWQKNTGQVRPK